MTPLAYSHHSDSAATSVIDFVTRAVAWSGISHLLRHLSARDVVALVVLALVVMFVVRRRRSSSPARLPRSWSRRR